MADLSGLPYVEIAFDRTAAPVDPGQADALVAALVAADAAADLVVLTHGWNDDADEARALYARFCATFAPALAANGVLAARRIQCVGVLWPSKRFDGPHAAEADPALAADSVIHGQLDRLEALTGTDLGVVHANVPHLRASATARGAFVARVLDVFPSSATDEEAQPAHVARVAADPHFLARLGTPLTVQHAVVGDGVGIGDRFAGIEAGAINLLNYTTYYVMKARAGLVGRMGLAPVLVRVRAAAPAMRLHLVGHSFGARLVTAAAASAGTASVDSLSLLQAAFSHYAFARGWNDGASRDGLFRAVVAGPAPAVRGATLVTHTRNDHVVGIAYAIASRVAGQIASAIGDAHDPYGGLGSNGALKTPEAVDLQLIADAASYAFAPGLVYNLDADGVPGAPGVITGHGDVCRPEVAHAVAEAVRASEANASTAAAVPGRPKW